MRQINCVWYPECLGIAAADDVEYLPCVNCKRCEIEEQRSDDPMIREDALSCCKLLCALFVQPEEPPPYILGYKITEYSGVLKAVRRVDGKRHIIHLGTLEGAEDKIQRYISGKV